MIRNVSGVELVLPTGRDGTLPLEGLLLIGLVTSSPYFALYLCGHSTRP